MLDFIKHLQLKRLDSWINDRRSKVSEYLYDISNEGSGHHSSIITSGETSLLSLQIDEETLLSIIKSRQPYYWWRQKVINLYAVDESSDVEGQCLEISTALRNSTNLQVITSIDLETNSCLIELVYPIFIKSLLTQNSFINEIENARTMISQQVIPTLQVLQEQQKNDQALLEEFDYRDQESDN